jgi:hypothetical protein
LGVIVIILNFAAVKSTSPPSKLLPFVARPVFLGKKIVRYAPDPTADHKPKRPHPTPAPSAGFPSTSAQLLTVGSRTIAVATRYNERITKLLFLNPVTTFVPMRPSKSITRRRFQQQVLASLPLACGSTAGQLRASADFPPVQTITRGPKFYWFGYYDKLQFSPDDRFVLSNRVDFEHRSPTADDTIEVGMIDTESNNEWIPLGTSRAWCWQQGCMLQWLPGHPSRVIWNDREKDRFVCHLLDVKTGERNTLPCPIYSVAPDGKSAVSCDFSRVADCRPGYGYAGLRDRFFEEMAPRESGVSYVDLDRGTEQLIVSHHQLATTGEVPRNYPDSKHHAYHLLHSPNGQRFIMLHRWTQQGGGHLTRLITAAIDGSDLRIVIPNGYASHFIWRDDEHLLSQAKGWLGNEGWGNFLFQDKEAGVLGEIGRGVLDSGGHFTYLSNPDWLVSDTYPKGNERFQTPHLYQISTNRRIDLGNFASPKEYQGEWRVDTHPRLSRTERWVCIDSPHLGQGRQLHLIDIRGFRE